MTLNIENKKQAFFIEQKFNMKNYEKKLKFKLSKNLIAITYFFSFS